MAANKKERWEAINRARGVLIEASVEGKLEAHEQVLLEVLNEYADGHLERTTPRPTAHLSELERRLNASISEDEEESS